MPSEKRRRQDEGRLQRRMQESVATKKQQRNKTARNLGGILVLLVAVAFLISVLGKDDKKVSVTSDTTSTTAALDPGATTVPTEAPKPDDQGEFAYGTGACPKADGSSPRTIDFTAAPQKCIDPAKTYTAVVETTAGKVTFALDTAATPGATNNFVALSRFHYYDDTELFRTSTSIGIIQGGSPHTQTNGDPGPGYTIPDEGFGDDAATSGSGGPFRYLAGDLVYARPGGSPDSSSGQFFFCATDACSGLDSQGIYIKFGKATEGLDVLQGILASAPQGEGKPSTTVKVTKVTITES